MLEPHMNSNHWQQQFREVYDRGIAAWRAGRTAPGAMFSKADAAFLKTIGCTAQELFDFVDDAQRYGEPDFDTAVAVAAIRRDYFLNVMKGIYSGQIVPMDGLPAKTAEVDGIAWLPRIMVKARLKLRGEMPDDLMYGCGGDRSFLHSVNLDQPGFLKLVWESGEDDRRIVDAVKRSARK
jgi:hypothetical protein